MLKFPNLLLQRLYTFGSLESVAGGVRFSLKNRLTDATVTRITRIAIDGHDVDLAQVTLTVGEARLPATSVSPQAPLPFPLRRAIVIDVPLALEPGKHALKIAFATDGLGDLSFSADDTLATGTVAPRVTLPYDKEENQRPEIIQRRRAFVADQTGAGVEHIGHYSFDPETTRGNIENFIGVAQIPIGLAGPLQINGEHAQGEFFIPLATTEGTLVASLQPRHEGAEPRRRRARARSSTTPCSARRSSSSTRRARRATSARGSTRNLPEIREARRGDVARREAALHRHLPREQVRLPALQLLDRRRRRPEHGRPRDVRRLLAGSSSSVHDASGSSTSSRTSPPTRRRRRSTSCARAASA